MADELTRVEEAADDSGVLENDTDDEEDPIIEDDEVLTVEDDEVRTVDEDALETRAALEDVLDL